MITTTPSYNPTPLFLILEGVILTCLYLLYRHLKPLTKHDVGFGRAPLTPLVWRKARRYKMTRTLLTESFSYDYDEQEKAVCVVLLHLMHSYKWKWSPSTPPYLFYPPKKTFAPLLKQEPTGTFARLIFKAKQAILIWRFRRTFKAVEEFCTKVLPYCPCKPLYSHLAPFKEGLKKINAEPLEDNHASEIVKLKLTLALFAAVKKQEVSYYVNGYEWNKLRKW